MITRPTRHGYHDLVRADVLAFLPELRSVDVLELGCGEGRTGARLKELGIARHVTGIEFDEGSAARAEERLDVVYRADLDEFELPESATFDLLLAPDVIEHLRDPWRVLDRFARHIRPGGYAVTSTPNIRFWRILYDLGIHGKWEYVSDGILDRTHLRFFTQSSIRDLHERAGLLIEEVGYSPLAGKRALLDSVTRGKLRDLLSGQHIVRSHKP